MVEWKTMATITSKCEKCNRMKKVTSFKFGSKICNTCEFKENMKRTSSKEKEAPQV